MGMLATQRRPLADGRKLQGVCRNALLTRYVFLLSQL